ncbi:MAG: TlpA family protein disulfide reductase [Bacteroidetes bacterium]|nr:MAG: TlpA family protein disulfide reductase [Bacteroidota bacterium]
MLILGSEPQVSLRGACPTLAQAQVLGSPVNAAYEAALKATGEWMNEHQRLIGLYRREIQMKKDPAPIAAQMAALDATKLSLLDSLKARFPFVAKAIALRTYLSYQNHGSSELSEPDYFAQSYFRFADFSDPAYQRMPLVQDAFKQYASNLAQLGHSHEALLDYVQAWLDPMDLPSRAHKTALLGLIEGFRGQNEDAFAAMVRTYLASYPQDNPDFLNQLRRQLASIEARLIGAVAPDIRLPSPTGDSLSLHELRGQVVLVDFWASWCAPCRKENPRVVRMYERFHEQGFEIFGVSLDNNQARWEEAIAKDKLSWLHVSDLKGWRSIAAAQYAVSAIPYTVLLDREGRIVAKGLRGAPLAAKVAELLEMR